MADQQWQQEAEEMEARDDSAQKKGRSLLVEEISVLGPRVLGAPQDSFTGVAESQRLDQAGKPHDLMAEEPDIPSTDRT